LHLQHTKMAEKGRSGQKKATVKGGELAQNRSQKKMWKEDGRCFVWNKGQKGERRWEAEYEKKYCEAETVKDICCFWPSRQLLCFFCCVAVFVFFPHDSGGWLQCEVATVAGGWLPILHSSVSSPFLLCFSHFCSSFFHSTPSSPQLLSAFQIASSFFLFLPSIRPFL
jgi:hypothetical protein